MEPPGLTSFALGLGGGEGTTALLRIRSMTAADVPLGMRLKEQAGWNQREADWNRLLDMEPEGCFVAEQDSEPVGTTATCVFGTVAWVAMVLVEAAQCGRGVGTALMRHALAHLDGRGVKTIRLDATPLGQPVYEKLGFKAEHELTRYEGVLPPVKATLALPRLALTDVPKVAAFDRAVTGTDRHRMLARLFRECPRAVRVLQRDGQVYGYLTARPGSKAIQIGPCIAIAVAGPLLFAEAAQRFAGRHVFLDVPAGNADAVQQAEALGLTVQRRLLRMSRGEPVQERIDELWASSGPEKG